MKVENPASARGTARERATVIPHPPPTTHRGELEAELEAELEVELEVELEIFRARASGSPLSHTKVQKLRAGIFVPLKIFSNLI